MEPATESRVEGQFSVILAGLQAGMLGVVWMLAWLGVSAKWQLRSFWTPENLMASIFYGDGALRPGFSGNTISGLATYLILYSLLGVFFAALTANRMPRLRLALVSVLFALCWYYLSFRLLGRIMMPLVALLHSARPTALGHVVYGLLLGRYPIYLPQPPAQAESAPIEPPSPTPGGGT